MFFLLTLWILVISKDRLYMEQVTSFFEDALGDNRRKEDDKILTKTMIKQLHKARKCSSPYKKRNILVST